MNSQLSPQIYSRNVLVLHHFVVVGATLVTRVGQLCCSYLTYISHPAEKVLFFKTHSIFAGQSAGHISRF
jgi:hypothetical protein